MNQDLQSRFEHTYQRLIEGARKSSIAVPTPLIVAATKKQPVEAINQYIAWARAKGIRVLIGENYVQEFKRKRSALLPYDEAHLIGPLQSNKVADAVRYFDVIQSVHTLDVLRLVMLQSDRQRRRLAIFLQVNISNDPSKSGFLPDQVAEALTMARASTWCAVQGLMTITRLYERPEEARPDFKRLRELRTALGWPDGSLSMGMSADFEVAVEEGATHVRIGTALFGDREA